MKLIIGLGNPGRNYDNTRHNAGFKVLERLTDIEDGKWGNEAKANALISRLKLDNEDVILALPQSYMNLSGEVVTELLKWFKLKINDLIIIHDELDLPFGTVQVKKNIGPAGHNGIKSIIERYGEDFVRIRIGIGKNENNIPSEKYVLDNFNEDELTQFPKIEEEAISKLRLLVKHGYEEFISKYNTSD